MTHFNTISELDLAEGFPPPEHPLFSMNLLEVPTALRKNLEFTCNCYVICFKKIKSGELWYGRTKYDHDTGLMFFTKPGQALTARGLQLKEKGFAIHVHEDFFLGHPLFMDVKKYGFFDYEIHEALYLSPREKEIMWSLFHKMETEYHNNPLELIHLYMISEAKNMLVTGERSISEIAYQLGFENPPYFSRLFKKEVGMSPKDYKNQLMN